MSLKKIRFDIVHNKGFHLKGLYNFLLLITAIIGTIFIVCELKEIRKQNELTELALRQGDKPLGIATTDTLFKKVAPSQRDTTFVLSKSLTNKGTGLLIYIGAFSFVAYKQQDFYKKSLIEIIRGKELFFDLYFNERRLTPFLPNETNYKILVGWENIRPNTLKYFYSVFLYKDQDGNLYHTVHLDYYRYIGIKYLHLTNSFFKAYTPNEHNSLHNYFINYSVRDFEYHPIADAIGRK